ncbi:MAG: sigma-54-dependent Fis family transcriptional regulator [Flavobacteriaceae bacterium]|nr:sigma-54-dependent Fis family transcriptional regulator [Flavobacteriaceae bacterium]
MENLQSIKQRFEIIGNDRHLNLAIEKAIRVAPTDISVLVTGESGVGKENIPKIIHHLSYRKHAKYIAVNCGAIPEGTIDSELFGHEKGAFTGATTTRKGYFEVADGGTIFLDEVGELPLTTQVRLLRVLENGEFIKVGSSQIQKTNVRIVAATNVKMAEAIQKGKFREDLYYRLNTVEINLPPLRERHDDIHLLFRKFATDFAQKHNIPTVRLTDDAVQTLKNYYFEGNIRQLKNIVEQLSILEESRTIDSVILQQYLPKKNNLPLVVNKDNNSFDFATEREIMYKILFDMRKDINDLKKLTLDLMENGNHAHTEEVHKQLLQRIYQEQEVETPSNEVEIFNQNTPDDDYEYAETIDIDESLSLQEKEVELIKKSLERNNGKRKLAAEELGISERTLYRKIKQYDL